MDVSKTENAKEIFRKLTTQTAYAQTFGDKPKAQEDFKVLKDKHFDRLPIAQVLRPHVRETLNKWLNINDQDKFTGRIFFTIREMYTVVKCKLADVPTSQDHHASQENMNITLPRFDKMITKLNEDKRRMAYS